MVTNEKLEGITLEIVKSLINNPGFNIEGVVSNPDQISTILVDFARLTAEKICARKNFND